MEELEKKIQGTLAGNWCVGVVLVKLQGLQ